MLTDGKYHLNTEIVQYYRFRYENLVGLIILLGQVRSSGIKDYCPTGLCSMHAKFLALSDKSQHTIFRHSSNSTCSVIFPLNVHVSLQPAKRGLIE
jgi:hypothetical protein